MTARTVPVAESDLRPGDLVTLRWEGTEFTAPVVDRGEHYPSRLWAAGWALPLLPGDVVEFVSATRILPDVPTTPVILVSEYEGEPLDPPVVMVQDSSDQTYFSGDRLVRERRWHAPDRITAWVEARVVPVGVCTAAADTPCPDCGAVVSDG